MLMEYTEEIDEGWPEDYHLTGLTGKALALAIDLRDYLEEQFRLKPHTFTDDEGETYDFDGCSSGCRLFQPKFSYVYSTGGYDDDIKYHSNDSGAILNMVFDGGILYDFLSYSGDLNYYDSKMHGDYMISIDRIAEKHGCMREPVTSICFGFYEN